MAALALAGTALTAANKASSFVTSIFQLGSSIESKIIDDECISSMYGYFIIKPDSQKRVICLCLRLGFIVGAINGGKRYSQDFCIAELIDAQDFPQKMQDSNITNTLNAYLAALKTEVVGRQVFHHLNKSPNDDFALVASLLTEGVLVPMIIYLTYYRLPPQSTPQSSSSTKQQPQPTTVPTPISNQPQVPAQPSKGPGLPLQQPQPTAVPTPISNQPQVPAQPTQGSTQTQSQSQNKCNLVDQQGNLFFRLLVSIDNHPIFTPFS